MKKREGLMIQKTEGDFSNPFHRKGGRLSLTPDDSILHLLTCIQTYNYTMPYTYDPK
jgi:hypothetical protein